MRSVYWSSAGAVFLDREAAVEALRALAVDLLRAKPTVRAVVLFGSLARGRGGPGSDADLLVILDRCSHERRADRIPGLLEALAGAPLPLDIHPYTLEELAAARSRKDPLVTTALSEGMVLAGQVPAEDG